MTEYERYQRERATQQAIRELWAPPLDTAVMKVQLDRPTSPQGRCAIQFERGHLIASPAMRHVMNPLPLRSTKDRGS